MLQKLSDNQQKVPAPDRNDMMRMVNESMKTVKFHDNKTFKSLQATNKLNGSEDFLVSDKIMILVAESMRKFRNKLIDEPPTKTVNLSINFVIHQKESKGVKVVREKSTRMVTKCNNVKMFLMRITKRTLMQNSFQKHWIRYPNWNGRSRGKLGEQKVLREILT